MTRANVRKIDEKLIKFFLQKHKIICCIMNSTRKAKVENKQIFTSLHFTSVHQIFPQYQSVIETKSKTAKNAL